MFRPSISSTCTARSLSVWLGQLEDHLAAGTSREEILASLPRLKQASKNCQGIDFLDQSLTFWRRLMIRKKDSLQRADFFIRGGPFRIKRTSGRQTGREEITQEGGRPQEGERKDFSSIRTILQNPLNYARYQVGARLIFFIPEWKEIGTSPWVLASIQRGFSLELDTCPTDYFIINKPLPQREKQLSLESEIYILLQKKVLLPVPEDQLKKGLYFSVFLIKKNGGIIRAHYKSKEIKQMPNPQEIQNRNHQIDHKPPSPELLYGNYVFTGCLLSCAHPQKTPEVFENCHLQYIGSRLCHFQFQALPFGLSSAPRIFSG
ncbi:uncharacterized protein LOC120977450 [Bufo bufo]|uniref:uncharacterized protein LOC120977450 n=1 Tax=Bufo bufo TaxID=8384 RepID=UPI001ABE5BDB|nr:uncharacterized protein LOC120977450 [Bufo bufo]